MLKPVKIIFSFITALLLLIVISVFTAYFLIDPNSYKADISAAVKEKTGRDLNFTGELKLSVFPWLGFKTGQMALSNTSGFQDQIFATIETSEIKLNLLPLLNKRIDVSRIVLDGLVLNLEKNLLGENNWDSFAANNKTQQVTPAIIINNEETADLSQLSILAVGGIAIEHAQINWRDQATGKQLFFKDIKLNTDAFSFDKPVSMNLTGFIENPTSDYKAAIQFSSQFIVTKNQESFVLNNSEFQATISSENIVDKSLATTLSVANIMLDKAAKTVKISGVKFKADDMVVSADLSVTHIDDHYTIQGPVIMSSFNPREIMAKIGVKVPDTIEKQALTQSSLNFNLSVTENTLDLQDLNLSIDNSQIKGSARLLSFIDPAITINLTADHLDVDRYLPSAKSSVTSKLLSPLVAMAMATYNVPVALLSKLSLDGQLSLASLKLNGLTLNDFHLNLNAMNGLVKAQQSAKSFYQGVYGGILDVDLRSQKTILVLDEKITHVNVESLLKDSKSKFQMTGMVDASLKLKSQGQTLDELKSSVNGDIHFLFKDTEVKGFNLQAMLNKAQVSIDVISPVQADHDLTQFSSISGSSVFANGIIHNNDLVASTASLRIKGKGTVDINVEQLDYKLRVQLIKTAATPTSAEQFYETPISVAVTGSLSNPSYALDVSGLLTEKNKAKIADFVDKNKEKIDSIVNKIDQKIGPGVGNLLKGLFSKH